MKKRYLIIGISITVVLIAVVLGLVFFRGRQEEQLKNISVNQLENIKIYVNYVNSKRICLDFFAPLDSSIVVSDNYALQKKSGNEWKALRANTRLNMEYSSLAPMPIDDEKYSQIAYESKLYEFIRDFDRLDKGSYRIIVGAKNKEDEYFLAVPFDVTLEYEYLEEPTDYEYSVTTSFGQEGLADEYEKCVDYITYSDFPLGFENFTFSLDLYHHLKKVSLSSWGEVLEISEEEKKRELYQYFSGAILTRLDDAIYGSTFFTDIDTLYYKTLQVPEKQKQEGNAFQLRFYFDYDGKSKEINCQVRNHTMKVEMIGLAFSDDLSERFPLGDLMPVESDERQVMEFYVFNDIEKALEEIK